MEEEQIEVQLLEQLGMGQEVTRSLWIPASLTLEQLICEQVAQSMPGQDIQSIQGEQARAIKAFNANGFFIIVDGKQREDLQESLLLHAGTSLRFIRLVPLVGG